MELKLRMKLAVVGALFFLLGPLWIGSSTAVNLDHVSWLLSGSKDSHGSVMQKRQSLAEEDNDVVLMCSDDKISELNASLSIECREYLSDENSTYQFEQEAAILCQSCGQPLCSFLECLNADPTHILLFDTLCSTNENGDLCYDVISGEGVEEEEVIAACSDMCCSEACRSIIDTSDHDLGCCLFSLVALNSTMEMAKDIWNACDVIPPGMCSPAFSLSSAPTEHSTSIEITFFIMLPLYFSSY